MAEQRIYEGDTVRFNIDTMKTGRFPRAADDVNQNSAMIVVAIDKDTKLVMVSRQGVVIDGTFYENELVKCDPETGEPLPPEPPPEETLAGGLGRTPNPNL